MSLSHQSASVLAVTNSTSDCTFYPAATVRCEGSKTFRSQAVRDVACLLDVGSSVISWRCMPELLSATGHFADLQVFHDDGHVELIDAFDKDVVLEMAILEDAAKRSGATYRMVTREEVYGGFRLRNAKDLLRYGNYNVPLGDRLRLLAALDEQGSLTVADSLKAFQETRPVAGLAVLILQRYLDVALDDAPLGPETTVRRITR